MKKGILGFGILDGSILSDFTDEFTGPPPWKCPKCGEATTVTVKREIAGNKPKDAIYKAYECSSCGWKRSWYAPKWEKTICAKI